MIGLLTIGFGLQEEQSSSRKTSYEYEPALVAIFVSVSL